MNKLYSIKLFSLALILLFFSACGLSSKPYPLVRTFTLDLPMPQDTNPITESTKPRATIMILTAPPPAAYESKKMVYKMASQELAADFYNEYYAPPTRAVADSFAKYLEYNNRHYHFIRSQGVSPPDYALEITVLDFYGDRTIPDTLIAHIALSITLTDLRGTNSRLVFTRNYIREVPAGAPIDANSRPAALAKAMVTGLSEIMGELEAELRTSLRGRS
ncbi:MAG: hypothetical protein LBE38_06100 [Deltaproteobacteria bacterium]|jgi:cholesterol transport system auxiliary component|nr:hypothetical protein [Deltaproteobacteria bacterium]